MRPRDLAASGATWGDLLDGISGSASLSLLDGTVEGVDLTLLPQMIADPAANPAGGAASFSLAAATLAIADGTLSTDDLRVEGPGYALDPRRQGRCPDRQSRRAACSASSAMRPSDVPFLVNGTWGALNFTPTLAKRCRGTTAAAPIRRSPQTVRPGFGPRNAALCPGQDGLRPVSGFSRFSLRTVGLVHDHKSTPRRGAVGRNRSRCGGGRARAVRAVVVFLAADRNGDGGVDRTEADGFREVIFDAIDTNKDGRLVPLEVGVLIVPGKENADPKEQEKIAKKREELLAKLDLAKPEGVPKRRVSRPGTARCSQRPTPTRTARSTLRNSPSSSRPTASCCRNRRGPRRQPVSPPRGEPFGPLALDLAALGDDRGDDHADRHQPDQDGADGVDLGRHAEAHLAVDLHRQRGRAGAGGEARDHQIVERQREGEHPAGDRRPARSAAG